MGNVFVDSEYLEAIADAIRQKLGVEDTYKPSEMADAISDIVTDLNTEELTIIANGVYSPSLGKNAFSRIIASVANTYYAVDEGKVVKNGALAVQTSKNITANGTVDTTDNNSVVVAVPNSYTASDEGKVVDEGELVAQGSQTITENGTYDTTLIAELIANISGGGGGVSPAIVIASSTLPNSAYTPENAFGTEISNYWGSNGNATDWLRMQFFTPVKITKIKFGNTLNLGQVHWSSARIIFQASNDGSIWTDLYDANNLTDDNDNLYEFSLQNNNEYTYYRFLCYKGSFWAGIGKIQLSIASSSGTKNILSGTDAPTSSVGEDGAIYLRYGLDGYTPVEYIQSSGTQFINTGYVPTLNTRAKLKINPQVITESGIFGSRWALNGFFLMFFQNKVRWHEGGAVDSSAITANTDLLIEADNANLKVNDSSYSVTPSTGLTGEPITIFFTTNTAGVSTPAKGQFKLYYLELYENDKIVKRYIPARRDSDDELGLYELYSGTFFANSGTGTFVAGADISDNQIIESYLKVNGVWQNLIGSDIDDVNTGGGSDGDDWTALKNYIESSGTQYIDTGYIANDNTRVEIVADINTVNSSYCSPFGARNGDYDHATKWFTAYKDGTALNVYVGTGGPKIQFGTAYYFGYKTKYDVSKSASGAMRADGLVHYGVPINGGAVDDVDNMYLFTFNENGSDIGSITHCTMKLYRFRIYENDTLVHEFIPWKDGSNVVCLKDTVTGNLKYNAGTGVFTYGTDS